MLGREPGTVTVGGYTSQQARAVLGDFLSYLLQGSSEEYGEGNLALCALRANWEAIWPSHEADSTIKTEAIVQDFLQWVAEH